MHEQQNAGMVARLRATIEEELGSFRRFSHLPATEIEEMAARLVQSVLPFVEDAERVSSRAA